MKILRINLKSKFKKYLNYLLKQITKIKLQTEKNYINQYYIDVKKYALYSSGTIH